MNGQLTLAKRYATAYVNLFYAQLDVPIVERAEQAADFLMDNPSALLVLKLSTIPAHDQRACLEQLLIHYKLPDTLLRLVDLLIEQNRLALFPHILYQMSQLYKQRQGIMEYTIKSVHKLDTQALALIRGFLEKLSGKRIIATEKIDKSLIAGIRLQSDTTLWEYSIQQQLRELQNHFNV